MNSSVACCLLAIAVVTFFASMSCVSAVKCYQCDSSNPMCLENFFVSVGMTTVEGCSCCRKMVDSEGTKRECAAGLSTIMCVPTSSNHVCASDLCNAASGPSHLSLSVLLGAAILVLSAAAFASR